MASQRASTDFLTMGSSRGERGAAEKEIKSGYIGAAVVIVLIFARPSASSA
jgi:hypothetical protein